MAKKKHNAEEHVNHERWLVSYADMITQLKVIFVVLYAMGQTDKSNHEVLRTS
jgi:chemotaxis protein MotB